MSLQVFSHQGAQLNGYGVHPSDVAEVQNHTDLIPFEKVPDLIRSYLLVSIEVSKDVFISLCVELYPGYVTEAYTTIRNRGGRWFSMHSGVPGVGESFFAFQQPEVFSGESGDELSGFLAPQNAVWDATVGIICTAFLEYIQNPFEEI